MTVSLDFLPHTVITFLLIFARLGTMMMLMPGFGAGGIPPRIRLGLALAVAFLLYPLISALYPPLPQTVEGIAFLLGHELAVGLILGGTARLLLSAAQVAGATIAYQTGLSFAQTADPSQDGIQGAIIGNFIGVLGVTLIFTTDLHYLVLAGIYGSYTAFAPTADLMLGDAAQFALQVVRDSFVVGVQMAAPFIIFGLVFYLGLGLLSRLMPQIQVFFIAMPANIIVGFILFALLLTMMMGWYLGHVETHLMDLVR